MQKFVVTNYNIKNEKIAGSLSLAVFSDLHCKVYEPENFPLIDSTIRMNPDMIIMSGDMITAREEEQYGSVLSLIGELVKLAPVYYSMGNHESRIKHIYCEHTKGYHEYENRLRDIGVTVLDNTCCDHSDEVRIYGVSIPLVCYTKGKSIPLQDHFLRETFRAPDPKRLNLLLAHNPAYVKQYIDAGFDITFSGHNHGGMVRLPGIGSILSPQFEFFPKYDRGCYQIGDGYAVVSAGLGDHSIKLRINNPHELIHLKIN